MKINILAFGIAKDIFGSSSVTITLPKHATVTEMRAVLETQYPRLKQLASYMVAVNNEYALADAALQRTDEVAIIPPVSGG